MVNRETIEKLLLIAEGKSPTDGPLPSPIEKILAQGIIEILSSRRR